MTNYKNPYEAYPISQEQIQSLELTPGFLGLIAGEDGWYTKFNDGKIEKIILENQLNQTLDPGSYSNALKGELVSGTYEDDGYTIFCSNIRSQVSPLPHNMTLKIYPSAATDMSNWKIKLFDHDNSFATVFESMFPENQTVSISSDLIKNYNKLTINLFDENNNWTGILYWTLVYNKDINALNSNEDDKITIIGGHYDGTWACDENEMDYQSGEQTIDLGITPKAVFIAYKGYIFTDEQQECWGGFAAPDINVYNDYAFPIIQIVENGFSVLSARNFNMSNTANPGDWGSNWGRLNEQSKTYAYIAIV